MRGSGSDNRQAAPEPRADSAQRMRFSPLKKGPLPDPHRHEKFTVATVEAALRKNKGMVARAARALRCTPQTVRNYLKRHPTLAQVVAEERELIVDTAELKLHEAVRRSEAWAICFCLKCLAKDRGYVERQERTGAGGQPLPSGPDNNVVVISGDKAEYIAKLRALRDAAQNAPIGVRPMPLPGDGRGHNGNVPS